jgi:hypothetical protein
MTKTSSPTLTLPIIITTTLPITEQDLKDILVTCVEGGSNYWLRCRGTVRDGDLNYLILNKPFDAETGKAFDLTQYKTDTEMMYRSAIDLSTIERGIRRMFEPGVMERRGDIRNALLSGDTGQIDAGDADAILQLGYFGEVIYG